MKKKGFTLIEILITIAVLAILAVIVIIAINPAQQFAAARNTQRQHDVKQISNAIEQQAVKNKGKYSNLIDSNWHMIGSASDSCEITCGQQGNSDPFIDQGQTAFDAGQYLNAQFLNNYVRLISGQISGSYASSIKNSHQTATVWSVLAWTPEKPTYKELPNNGFSGSGNESGYPLGNANMTSNVLLFHANETGSGGVRTVYDTSSRLHNGTTYNFAAGDYNRTGKLRSALNFDGTNNYVSIPSNTDIDSRTTPAYTNRTIELWFYSNNLTGRHVIYKEGTTTNAAGTSGQGFVVYTNSSNLYVGGFNRSATPAISWYSFLNIGSLITGRWYHVALTLGPANNTIQPNCFIGYLNGQQINQGSCRQLIAHAAATNIGRSSNAIHYHDGIRSSSAYYFNGLLDEMAIYNRTLTAIEIQDHYLRGALRLRFQARSCDDQNCIGENFIGPDGSTSTYYSELNNTTLNPPSFSLTNITANKFFQYQAYLDSDQVSYTPGISRAQINHNGTSNGDWTEPDCISLASELVPLFLPAMPYDPKSGSLKKTFYAATLTDNNRLEIRSCKPELDQNISIKQ